MTLGLRGKCQLGSLTQILTWQSNIIFSNKVKIARKTQLFTIELIFRAKEPVCFKTTYSHQPCLKKSINLENVWDFFFQIMNILLILFSNLYSTINISVNASLFKIESQPNQNSLFSIMISNGSLFWGSGFRKQNKLMADTSQIFVFLQDPVSANSSW